jgi:type I restriction enzyme S subunit
MEECNKKVTYLSIKAAELKLILIPLPPLAEQKRIVSKVDELMSICDKLEARRQKKQEIQSKLNSSALDRMLSAENQEEFEQHWQRICENFDLLYDNPENVGKLKQAILQLAVQGKLVEQDSDDELASVLIEKIKDEEKS